MQTIPFLVVSVNRYGFSHLDVRLNLVNTTNSWDVAYSLVEATCQDSSGKDLFDANLKELYSDKETPYRDFFIGDNLISLHFYKKIG